MNTYEYILIHTSTYSHIVIPTNAYMYTYIEHLRDEEKKEAKRSPPPDRTLEKPQAEEPNFAKRRGPIHEAGLCVCVIDKYMFIK